MTTTPSLFQKYLQPYGAALLSSESMYHYLHCLYGLPRRVRGTTPVVEVFLDRSDPYSQLVAQVLPDLQKRFRIALKVWEVSNRNSEMFPEAEFWERHARRDAQALAELYQLESPSPDHMPELSTTLQEGEKRREKLGHYLSAMFWFEGEWFWGLDRLDHLEQRLLKTGCQIDKQEGVTFHRTAPKKYLGNPSDVVDPKRPLIFYFSMRSPYSYLALERAEALTRHYQVPLDIRPLLPMVMRGVPVPPQKKMYIFRDTCREARKLGIPYGRVADPLGVGVENCYALFDYARSCGKGTEFLLAYARAVNAEGVHSDTVRGLKYILSKVDLEWHNAQAYLKKESWRKWAGQHCNELYEQGLWGVPSFVYKEGQSCWGQDRLWLVERWLLGSL